ncbi:hypothetical protein [Vagococcus silagei]|uniref:hypothetical protein n=1 Tax=Vagococcus silagei TaxID=2508885 RepID=UPI0013A64621|nr:hypothetical protein [Vagococcus silagei]
MEVGIFKGGHLLLAYDFRFKLSLGFLYSEFILSEATFSRIYQTLVQHQDYLDELNYELLQVIHQEFGIFEEDIALDVTAINGHSKPHKTKKTILSKRNIQQQMATDDILDELTHHPTWGVKKKVRERVIFGLATKATWPYQAPPNIYYLSSLHLLLSPM